jgi:hypothetical protein
MVGWKFRVRNIASGETYWYPKQNLVRDQESSLGQAATTKSGIAVNRCKPCEHKSTEARVCVNFFSRVQQQCRYYYSMVAFISETGAAKSDWEL